ncbi:TonB-dependent receptor [Arundinibacter roseus]|uniref:TonB-dependent receptor n=1 Tax=Arundinibacter roseus TaxID=2070510 RepID=A0A4R4KCU3_9BACT|nr:TonB-dependent receptor [Arundinibacter roseus]TDB64566.1 TonB-dependent receptor [Arundinibacter roseus]
MNKNLLFTLCLWLSSALLVHAQTNTTTIRGSVQDFETRAILAGASVQLIEIGQGTITAADGSFRFEKVPVGRYSLKITSLGYSPYLLPELLLESGKEKIVSISLAPSTQQLDEAMVISSKPLAFSSIQEITVEQTLRYAATYLDPARVATSFPGVASANDQANGLVIRGNTPNGMQWRLEGVEIVNPNHLSNAGTFSDRATQTGGGVNILSTQLLDDSYFLTGAFPAEYGNALSGVLDMKLRTGNNEQTEFTAQAGLIGLDVAAEGPFSKKSKASYLVNYRYSFTGLLGAMGVTFGGEDIRFQDLSFTITLPTAKHGEFKFFGLGGYSSNIFKASRNVDEWVFQKDGFDIDYTNAMGAVGLTHSIQMGPKTSVKSVLVTSALENGRDGYILSKANTDRRFLVEEDAISKSRLSYSTTLSHRLNAKHLIKTGLFLTYQVDEILSRGSQVSDGRMEGTVIQPYATWQWKPAKRLTTELGLHYLGYTYNKTNSVEPRAAVHFQASPRQSISFSYGLHSQLQQPQVYLAVKNSNTQANDRPNRLLSPTRAHHFVAGYQQNLSKGGILKIETYLQNIFDVPVVTLSPVLSYRVLPSFSTLNLVENFVDQKLENAGTGRNYGVEVSYQKYLTKGYYVLISGSLYNSTYVGGDGIRRSTRYNGGHTFSFTGGKEIITKKQAIWGFNTRILWLGGFRDTPIDLETSQAEQTTVYSVKDAFTVKMKDYFRPDLRIYWKKNHAKYNRTLALDIQNVSNTENEAFSYYDILQRQLVPRYQLGMIPVLSYRWEF